MTPFDLVRFLRSRMVPLVGLATLAVAVIAPTTYHVEKRRELVRAARRDADRVAQVLRGEIEENPRLWRYNLVKLSERLAEEGLDHLDDLTIHTQDGAAVPIATALGLVKKPGPLLYGRAEVEGGMATVWVGRDRAPLYGGTLALFGLCAALAAVLGTLLYVLPMWAIKTAQRRISALTGRMVLDMQEEDRRRIASDLHDGAGQALTAARLHLLTAQRHGDPQSLSSALRLLDEALEEVRRSTYALLPPALSTLGLAGALRRHCEEVAFVTGLSIECDVEMVGKPIGALETACYRIVQEALTNITRHACAKKVTVHLCQQEGRLLLSITDDGVGRADRLVPGAGILGMAERIRLLSGTLEIRDQEVGLRILVNLPL